MHNARRTRGVTLIELLLVLVLLSVGLLGLSGLYATGFRALDVHAALVDSAQLAQACVERALDARHRVRPDGGNFELSAFTPPSCATPPAGFVVQGPQLSAVYVGTGDTLCPQGLQCRDLSVTVTHPASGALSSVDWLLVAY